MEVKIIVDGKEIKNNYSLKIKDKMNIKCDVKSDDIHFLANLVSKDNDELEYDFVKKISEQMIEENKVNCNCNLCNELIDSIKHKECNCVSCQIKRIIKNKIDNIDKKNEDTEKQ